MAFSTEEEAKIRSIMTAFDNGKRLDELPLVSGETNPFNLICEVLDVDGESKQAKLAEMLPYLESQCAYGVSIDNDSSAKTVTRVGSVELHKSLPIHSKMRGCLLDDDGNVVEYLNPNDWRMHDRSGASGQVMVEITVPYAKFSTNGAIETVMFSEHPLPGYTRIGRFYRGAYEGSVQRSTSKLCSVANLDADYRGGNNNTAYDDTYRSFLGRPATSISETAFRTYARNRKAGSTEWNQNTELIDRIIYWLYVVEFANRDWQAPVNAELTSEGYRQGGLGNGVTTLSSTMWSEFNGSYPFVPCGHTDELGNGTGEVAYTMVDENGDDLATVYVPRWRGIENPFGHILEWRDGVLVDIRTDDYDGDFAGQSRVFVAKDPANFASPTALADSYEGYEFRGLEARAEGYMKKAIFGENGDIMPAEVGGGSTTHYCDYHYTSITSSSIRGVLFGGRSHGGSYAGFSSARSYSAPSTTYSYIGSRLCFIPAE